MFQAPPPQTKLIAGVSLETAPMSPLTNYPLGMRLLRVLMPVLTRAGGLDPASLREMAKAAGDLAKIDVAKALLTFGPLIEALTSELVKPENARLPEELLAATVATVEVEDAATGQPTKHRVQLDRAGITRVYHGNLFGMLGAMLWSAQVNFADFFRGASALARSKGAEVAASPSDSTPT